MYHLTGSFSNLLPIRVLFGAAKLKLIYLTKSYIYFKMVPYNAALGYDNVV
ncbi:hypothetical protein SCFA_3110006 [anaerobic digester metagenome]|uniref:Uncharacterized protein n=1 Tax=anaerobic digester metagenome TaxID=1263854 RepID=A0A485M3U2_9ZZZZ